ncbi:MAG: helix-turn-helix transcriptional regulator [Promethearchaeota archaeon]
MKNRLKELRARDGFTQADLAQKLDITRQTVLAIEKQKYNPSLVLAFKIAKVFNSRIEEIFLYEE